MKTSEKLLEKMITNCQDRIRELEDYLTVSYNKGTYTDDSDGVSLLWEDHQWISGYRYATRREIEFLKNLLETLSQ
jgi:hypothetical protein